MNKLPAATVHGRFQPPLHENHWMYIEQGFERAEHVTILITNPYRDESFEETADWRHSPENNPFTYDERRYMFSRFFTAMGIGAGSYDFCPFNIKDDSSFGDLDRLVPNIVNVYSPWSAKKVELFEGHGLPVIRLDNPEVNPVSGSLIRSIIMESADRSQLPDLLTETGFMPQAVPGLLEVLASRQA